MPLTCKGNMLKQGQRNSTGSMQTANAVKMTKPSHVLELVRKSVKDNFLFRHLTEEAFTQLVERMQEIKCDKGKVVCQEGDRGDFFYVVESGSYGVYQGGVQVHKYTVAEGQINPSFGELGLMYAKPRAATVKCLEKGTLWALDRVGFREAQKTRQEADVVKILSKVELLKALSFAQLQQLRDTMKRQVFSDDENVISEGEPGNAFYVITSGTASVSREGQEIGVLNTHSCFGESALITNSPRNASVTARDGELHTLTLDRETFEQVLGPLSKIIEGATQKRDRMAKRQQNEAEANGLVNIKVESFKLTRLARGRTDAPVGGGDPPNDFYYLVRYDTPGVPPSGPISLVARAASYRMYTLRMHSKALLEDGIDKQAMLEELRLARKLQLNAAGDSVMLPPIVSAFQDDKGLYALYACKVVCTLQQLRKHATFDEACILFALASVFSGLQVLHEQHIVLRGVASWLIFVNDTGYVSICDLRYAAEMTEPSYSLIGPREIIAPEQVRGSGHSFAADFWALGVLGYELAQGHHPFSKDGQADDLTLAKAVTDHAYGGLRFDNDGPLSGKAQAVLQMLMHPDQEERLSAPALSSHELFAHINWRQLGQGGLRSPLADHAAAALRSGDIGGKRNAILPEFVQGGAPQESSFLKDWA